MDDPNGEREEGSAQVADDGSEGRGEEGSVIPELAGFPPSLTTRQVAEVMGLTSPASVSQRLEDRTWPGFKVGTSWRVRRSVVQAIMLGQDPWGAPPGS